MHEDHQKLEDYAKTLEDSGAYRVLRRLPAFRIEAAKLSVNERIALILDTETTGLDPSEDEIVELAALAVVYTTDGSLGAVVGSFSQLREPSIPLSRDVTALTGITPEMLEGKTLCLEELEALVRQAALIIAHNASFDRPFCERLSPVFKRKPWACSATEVAWSELGFDGAKLTYLVNHAGWFYEAHRALDDCNALRHLLGYKPPSSSQTVLNYLLASAREERARVSFSAPFSSKSVLRKNGYRWKPASSSQPGYWYIDVEEKDRIKTVEFLHKITDVPKASIRIHKMAATNRYKD